VRGVRESLSAVDLVEQALRLDASSLARHQIQVVREYSEAPPVEVEPHTGPAILVNFIRNAQHALDLNEPTNRRLIVRVGPKERRTVSISSSTMHGHRAGESESNRRALDSQLERTVTVSASTAAPWQPKNWEAPSSRKATGLGKGATFTLELPCQ